ncbi:P-loop containing nucleoside triphosphate hydrolase protein [Panus rudis PR-1116 ss-1]|nr:P-loop containing nucleoside triphosphate hydrolase protein [Panus rudis PR-1116 ss-1]
MPPKKGIVKSGNAGNSSKATKPPVDSTKPDEKPLFPPGYKYPLSLLHERCQQNGWEKPSVETRKSSNGYSFSVILSRVNKKTSERETVRMDPHPPKVLPTAIEARHWGATYALYRFCNGIQLKMVLPPGPRDYWVELAEERKKAPEHQQWMYDADPFAARRAVNERQTKAAAKQEERSNPSEALNNTRPGTSREFTNAPEVKMATTLREFVERSIKKAKAGDPASSTLQSGDVAKLQQQLRTLGFNANQVRNVTTALSQPSPITFSLLSSQQPLQACIEYLILHIPECDLPKRFIPDQNASGSFVTGAHSGSDDLTRRWMQEKAVKQGGFPVQAVQECMEHCKTMDDWPLLIRLLNKKLAGEAIDDLSSPFKFSAELEAIDEEEVETMNGRFEASNEIYLPAPMAPLQLHVTVPPERALPKEGEPPPMYITSIEVAAYVRLHILRRLLLAIKNGTFADPSESFVMASIRILEEEWAHIQDHGPPDMSSILRYLLPRQDDAEALEEKVPEVPTGVLRRPQRPTQRRRHRIDSRSDDMIKEEFHRMCADPRYKQMMSARERLPAFQAKHQFLKCLSTNQCVVIVGETGCGKTTQLPQFILDSLITSGAGSRASIIVTQPRRLSALGVASRVSSERLDDGSVGYAIRGESKQDERTKLLFCTTGVVLRRLASGDKLQDVTHVVVDEVHERSVDGDLLLLQLKELMKRHKDLKVVLMSATINHQIFVDYFNNAPLLTIPGFTHPVTDIYVEDVLPLLPYRPASGRGSKRLSDAQNQELDEYKTRGLDEDVINAIHNITKSDRIDYELVAAIVNHIVKTAEDRAGILIFLPGVQEIRQCIESLRSVPNAKLFPLHANLSSEEQRAVFAPTSSWKIIAATNVAETSITIDDIVYVIDCGKVKETQYDPQLGLTKLVEQWVTRAAAKQRRGRAGRTRPGFCYKVYTRRQEERFDAFPVPEIKRVPLESVSLTVKVLHEDVKTFLSRALDPPDMAAMEHSLKVLKQLSAIDENEDITPLGQHLAALPLDLRLGKMLILATIFQCLNPVLTVAACVSSKPLFFSPHDKREEASQARERLAYANSDLLTDVHAYEECFRLRQEGASQSAIRSFCDEARILTSLPCNFISPSTVRDITSLRNELFSALSSLDFVPPGSSPQSAELNTNSTNTNLIKAVILGGLWPRVARVHLPRSAIKFDRVQAGTVQRENTAKQFKFFDITTARSTSETDEAQSNRVFLHPSSVLFGQAVWKSPFVTYFQKQMTSKVWLRDATEVPMYALLLFGGLVSVNHIGGGLTVGDQEAFIKLKAWPRIGVLVNQLRRLLDVQLARAIDDGTSLTMGSNNPVVQAMLALLTGDGLSTD